MVIIIVITIKMTRIKTKNKNMQKKKYVSRKINLKRRNEIKTLKEKVSGKRCEGRDGIQGPQGKRINQQITLQGV